MPKKIDLTGKLFGRLTVIRETEKRSHGGSVVWECSCECGGKAYLPANTLRFGATKSCGCLQSEYARTGSARRTHGMSGSGEYSVWLTMKQRCTNKNNKKYPRYGGRGITVCPEWMDSFERFYADMGPRPTPKHQIDRENNNGNYDSANCRWVTSAINSQNRSTTRLNEVAVRVIRYFYYEKEYSQKRIGAAYGIRQNKVSEIVRQETWGNFK